MIALRSRLAVGCSAYPIQAAAASAHASATPSCWFILPPLCPTAVVPNLIDLMRQTPVYAAPSAVLPTASATGCKLKPVEEAETLESVIVAAANAGHEVSRYQLRRWHRAELIGRPRQQPLGRGRGTVTVYPVGTSARVLAICRRQRAGRTLEDLRWLLWWDGFEVADEFAIGALGREVEAIQKEWDRLFDDDGLTEEAEDFLDKSPDVRLPAHHLAWVRRRLGRANFDAFLQSLLLIFAGRVDELGPAALEQVERGLGLDRARSDRLANGEPWIPADEPTDFVEFGRLVQPGRLADTLAEVEPELRSCRDEVRAFASTITTIAHFIRTGFDRWAFGVGLLGQAFDELEDDPAGQRRLLLLWISMRDTPLREGMEAIVALAPGTDEAEQQWETLRELRQAIPAVGEALPAAAFARAAFDESRRAALEKAVARVRESHGTEIDQFFAEHANRDTAVGGSAPLPSGSERRPL